MMTIFSNFPACGRGWSYSNISGRDLRWTTSMLKHFFVTIPYELGVEAIEVLTAYMVIAMEISLTRDFAFSMSGLIVTIILLCILDKSMRG
jgi:hypothetical protein